MKDHSIELKEFGTNLRNIRNSKGLSLAQLGLLADIDSKHLSKIERGLFDIRFSTCLRLISALDVENSGISTANLVEFGSGLRGIRKDKGLTLPELGALADVNWKHLSKIELGQLDVRITTIIAIIWSLDIYINELFPKK